MAPKIRIKRKRVTVEEIAVPSTSKCMDNSHGVSALSCSTTPNASKPSPPLRFPPFAPGNEPSSLAVPESSLPSSNRSSNRAMSSIEQQVPDLRSARSFPHSNIASWSSDNLMMSSVPAFPGMAASSKFRLLPHPSSSNTPLQQNSPHEHVSYPHPPLPSPQHSSGHSQQELLRVPSMNLDAAASSSYLFSNSHMLKQPAHKAMGLVDGPHPLCSPSAAAEISLDTRKSWQPRQGSSTRVGEPAFSIAQQFEAIAKAHRAKEYALVEKPSQFDLQPERTPPATTTTTTATATMAMQFEFLAKQHKESRPLPGCQDLFPTVPVLHGRPERANLTLGETQGVPEVGLETAELLGEKEISSASLDGDVEDKDFQVVPPLRGTSLKRGRSQEGAESEEKPKWLRLFGVDMVPRI